MMKYTNIKKHAALFLLIMHECSNQIWAHKHVSNSNKLFI